MTGYEFPYWLKQVSLRYRPLASAPFLRRRDGARVDQCTIARVHRRRPAALFLQGPPGEDPDTLHPHLGELRADLEPIRDLLIGTSFESGTAGGLLRNEQLAGYIRRLVLELGVEAAAPIAGRNHLAERVLEKMVAELMTNAGLARRESPVELLLAKADGLGKMR